MKFTLIPDFYYSSFIKVNIDLIILASYSYVTCTLLVRGTFKNRISQYDTRLW